MRLRPTRRPAAVRVPGDELAARVVHQVASWCLAYPDEELVGRLPLLTAAVDELPAGRARDGLRAFLDHASATPLDEQRRTYVHLFDLSRHQSLYLSYWTDGDTRRRGEVLAAFKERYRSSGFLVDTRGELPDHLPLVLEYAAVADPVDGPVLLQEYRPSLELIRFALLETGSPYAGVLEAVCATLPGPSPADKAAVHAMAAAGPPRESVGLDASDPRLLPLSEPVPTPLPTPLPRPSAAPSPELSSASRHPAGGPS